jgi:hypothetical protein
MNEHEIAGRVNQVAEPTTIDVTDCRSVTYWTSKLRCSWPQLSYAIKQVGKRSFKGEGVYGHRVAASLSVGASVGS